MFKSIRKYVVLHDGIFYARCDAGGDKVKLPKDVYTSLPDDARHAFNKLKPFSFFDQSGRPAQPNSSASATAPSSKKPPRQPKPEKPANSAPVFTASVGLSPQNASSVPEASPSLGPMMAFDPRYLATHDPRQFMCAPSQFGPQVVPYGASLAPPVHFMPIDQNRAAPGAMAFGAISDPYESHRAPVQFQNSPQMFFASPVQHQLGQYSAARAPDGSGGGYSSATRTGFPDGSGGGFSSASGGGYQGSGGGPPQASSGGFQGSSQPPSQQSSHSGKLLLGASDGVPWRC